MSGPATEDTEITASARHAASTEIDATAALARDLRVVIGKLQRRLREHAHLGDLTSSQLAVLGRLERDGPATVSALARAEGMRPQSMGAIICVVEAAGLVVGTGDPTDGRQTIFSLTPRCLEWVRASRAARQDWLQRAVQTIFGSEEQGELARAVDLLNRLAGS